MGITLFLVVSAAALCAAVVVVGSRTTSVAVPAVGSQDTLDNCDTLARSVSPVRREWQVTSVKDLAEAEELLDCLESQGYEERELIVQGNDAFAVRWR